MKKILYIIMLGLCAKSAWCQDTSHMHFDSLFRKYQQGSKDYRAMPRMVGIAEQLGHREQAAQIARDYINNYLSSQDDSIFFTGSNVALVERYDRASDSKAFQRIYQHPDRADKVSKPGSAANCIALIIRKEEIAPYLPKNDGADSPAPDWRSISKRIACKYSEAYAKRAVLDGQIRWAELKKDSVALVGLNIEKIDRYGQDTTSFGKLQTNNMIYYIIFMHSNDKTVLNKAIGWMELILKTDAPPGTPEYIDTYANLLYKAGRVSEALRFEARALQLLPKDSGLQNTYLKMQSGQPTWLNN